MIATLSRATPVIVQGITGRMGSSHAVLMRAYGTNIVGGTSTRSGIKEAAGVPVFASCADAVLATGAVASVAMAPPEETWAAMQEALAAGIKLIVTVAEQHGWPLDWLNDSVKGFLSARDQEDGMKLLSGEFPSADEPGLRIFVPRPEYLFAMKCRAMRLGAVDENADVDDIRRLATELGLQNAGDAITLVGSFYPRAQLQPKVQLGIEAIFSDGSDTL